MSPESATYLMLSMVNTIIVVLTYLKTRHVEHNTNSIKDALVKATREGALLEGEAIGVAKQKAEGSG